MRRLPRPVALPLALLLALAGCGAPVGVISAPGTGTVVHGGTCTASACQPGGGTESATVFVEPDAGAAPVVHAINQATTSVLLEVYLLTDSDVIRALESAANRGVDVRVLLELAPYGQGSVSPQVTLERLRAAGVKAQGADPSFQYTHAKLLVIDDSAAFIMTCNLTLSGLGGSRSAVNRDYGVIDRDPADVAEAAAVFAADWARTALRQTDPNLVISPVDARAKLSALLASARTELLLEDEELLDPQMNDALMTATRRGVTVEVVLPAPSDESPAPSSLTALLAAGVRVRYSSTLYMHAKLILVDGHQAFVGSENFSATSLDANREVGVIVANPAVLGTLSATFATDWSDSAPA